jgi:LPS-assembly lipoprotein
MTASTSGRRVVLGWALALISTAGFAPAGCGWAPLYADQQSGPADEELRAVRVAPIPERIGQRLELALRNTLNPEGIPSPQHYLLRTTLQTVRSDLGVQTTGIGTRGKLDVNATYALSDSKTGAQLFANTSHVAESFDIVANEYAATVAEDDARTRAVEELRRDILTRLTLYLQRRVAEARPPGAP